jgi:hypothetical protein
MSHVNPAALADLDQVHAEYNAILDGFIADTADMIRAGKDPVQVTATWVQGAIAGVLLDTTGERVLKMVALLAVAIVRLAQQPEVAQ